jgi:hypothetical protein
MDYAMLVELDQRTFNSTYGVLRVVRRIVLVSTLTSSFRVHNNSNSLPVTRLAVSLALVAVLSCTPKSSFSAFSALSLNSTNTRLLLRLLRPPLMVAENLSLTLPSTSPTSILIVRILVLLNNTAQSCAGRRSRSANLLRSRIEELLRRRRTSDCSSHLAIPRSVVVLSLLLFCCMRAASSIIAGSFSSNRRRSTLRSCTLAWNRPCIRRHTAIMSSRSSLWTRVRLRALRWVRAALSSSRTRRSVMLRPVVFVALAAFGPDPGCQAADGDGADCDQGNPVAESGLLARGRGRRVKRATRALGAVGGHGWVLLCLSWPHWARES